MLNDRRTAAQTPAEKVRDTLSRIENRIGQFAYSNDEELLALLPLLDELFEQISLLQDRGVAIPAEWARFEGLASRLKRHAKEFLKKVGGTQALVDARENRNPPETHWWWFLDVYVADQRRAYTRRNLRRAAVAMVFLLVLAGIYMQFFAPPKEVRLSLRYEQEAEAAYMSDDYAMALDAVEEALVYRPEWVDLHVFAGILEDLLGRPDQAELRFATARSLAESEEAFLMNRAQRYLSLELPELALQDAEAILADNDVSAYGYYVKGNALGSLQEWDAADAAYAEAEALAKASDDVELEAMARTQRAYLTQIMFSAPAEDTPQEPAEDTPQEP